MSLTEVLASPVRLRICGYLAGCDHAEFQALQDYCAVSQPTLSRQLTVLHEEDLVVISKVASGRYTKTRVGLSATGRAGLAQHVLWLQQVADGLERHDTPAQAPQH